MKKSIFTMFALALAAFTFTGCEDVPMPYDMPTVGITSGTVAEPKGSGTAADPFNAAGINKYIEDNLASGESSTTDLYVLGIVSQVKECSPSYGNATFYISEDGKNANTFYVYQCLGVGNKKISTENDVEVGDTVIICGKVTNYSGTFETVKKEAYIYSIKKSDGTSAGEEPGETNPSDAKGNGTLNDPYNPTAANAFIATLAADAVSENDIYIKGKVKEIKEAFSSYGNTSLVLTENGIDGDEFLVWRALGLGNQKCTDPNAVKVGDEVIICGKVVNFKGNTPETAQGQAYIYSLNGKTAGGEEPNTPDTPSDETPEGDGTAASPYNAVAACNYISAMAADVASENDIYIKGIISSVKEKPNSQYGNATFYISADGKTSSTQFYVFRCHNLDDAKFSDSDVLNVGDEVVICGKVVNYRGNTPETVQGQAHIVSIKPTENGGGNTGGGNVGSNGTIVFSEIGFSNQQVISEVTTADGVTITFDKGSNTQNNVPTYYTSGSALRCYWGNTISVRSEKTLKAITIQCTDPYNGTVYNGGDQLSATPGTLKKTSDKQIDITDINSKTVTINNVNSESKGGQLRMVSISFTYAE